MASASPDTAAHAPRARARMRRSGKIWRIIDSVPGSEAAAPTPMMTRPTTSSSGLVESAQTTDPMQKIATPISITRLRPKLSPSDPHISIKLANANA